jgi:hypothetical protein
MSKQSEQWYFLSDDVLSRLCSHAAYPDAIDALNRSRQIKDLGHTPAVYYSKFNRFRVLDEDDEKQGRISQGIADRSKPFPI